MNTIGSPATWTGFAVFAVAALIVDFPALRTQGPHKVSIREAAVWSVLWVLVSFVFVGCLWIYESNLNDAKYASDRALEFVTGYLVEKALAVDNIFVFLMLFTYFGVRPESQKRVLMIGILGALGLRAILIILGAWLIAHFHAILYLFGAFLLITGVKMWWAAGQEPDFEKNLVLKWLRNHVRIAPRYDGEKMFTVIDGARMSTPLLVVIVLVAVIDVIFAVDSIPAIFAITTDPFIVLSSNTFAILGLRAMFFLLAGMHERFHLLPYGLAVVLAFIGSKMMLMDLIKIPIGVSLAFTVSVLVVTMALSLRIPSKQNDRSNA